jgi:long-subunit fatty acid transport protein
MKKLLAGILILVQAGTAIAQDFEDAHRFSDMKLEGSARFTGMGGAFGAIGADLTSIHINPAGMARYTKNDFGITLGNNSWRTDATFKGTGTSDVRNNFAMPSLGLVFTGPTDEKSPSLWKSAQFGVTFNRTNNFNQNTYINGIHENSLSYYFAGQAAGTHPDDLGIYHPFGAYLAYQTYVIDPTDSLGTSYTSQAVYGDGFEHQKTINRRGSMYETAISFSGNYDDKFYLGASLVFPGLRFEEMAAHREIMQDENLSLKEFTYFENLTIRGSGFGARIGAILLPTEFLRLGLSYQTPFTYNMRDNWSASMKSEFDTVAWTMESLPGTYNYRLRTPGRVTASAALVLNRRGMISVDYEFSDYSRAKFLRNNLDLNAYNFNQENQNITRFLRPVNNLRIGGELRVTQELYLRGGFGLTTPGFSEDIVERYTPRYTYSGGIGYRNKDFYADLGYSLMQWFDDYYMYDPTLLPNATTAIDNKLTRIVASVGVKF